jgi:D-lactate dehydrogenase (cytochrome)
VTHRIATRRARDADVPRIERDPAVVAAFLSDAAHVAGGFSAGVATPSNDDQVAALVASAAAVLPIGAQSSLTGGATPRGDVILSTRALTSIDIRDDRTVRAGAGVPLVDLQRALGAAQLFFPPVPTFEGAFVGGVTSTNAAGAATFKYGATRRWVDGMTVVLASGELLDITRGQTIAAPDGSFEIVDTAGRVHRVPVPRYAMPAVAKLSAGYFAAPDMDLIDLFIGAEGTLGIVTSATLRVVPRPRRVAALVRCDTDAAAIALTHALRDDAHRAWHGGPGLDVAAIEYMDGRGLRLVPRDTFARAGIVPVSESGAMLLLQIELSRDEGAAYDRLLHVLTAAGIADDPVVAAPDDQRAAQQLFELRESVPASVNAAVAAAKARVGPGIEKTAGDMVVPTERLGESLALYRHAFERRGLDYAIWGHASDGNLHPNVLPRSLEDVRLGREALIEIARGVMALGGAPLAEHGVGRSAVKRQLLRELYGADGIAQMRAVKRALDPDWKLARGVLFDEIDPA